MVQNPHPLTPQASVSHSAHDQSEQNPLFGPVLSPELQVSSAPHQPQLAFTTQSEQPKLLSQHCPEPHAQLPQMPLLGPEVLPVLQVLVSLHHPQGPSSLHEVQSVYTLQGSVHVPLPQFQV